MSYSKARGPTSQTARRPRLRPRLEVLEGRAMLSVGGSPDFSFGPDGFRAYQSASPSLGFQANASATQADGKTVVVGALGDYPTMNSTFSEFAVARYDADGTLDPTFGTGGYFTSPGLSNVILPNDGVHPASAQGVAIQPDGGIVVVGSNATGSTTVVRLTSAGAADPTFGTGGIVTLPAGFSAAPGGGTLPASLAVLADGQIAVAGGIGVPAVDLLNADGSIATGFGTDGSAVVSLPPGEGNRTFSFSYFPAPSASGGLVAQPDGKIVVAANIQIGSPGDELPRVLVTRFDADGTLDPTFGTGGEAIILPPFEQGLETFYASTLALQTDGKIVIGGLTGYFDLDSGDTLVRLNPGGSLDTTFGEGGYNVLANEDRELPPNQDHSRETVAALAIGPDGSILVGDASFPLFSRVHADGITDNTFGTGGTLLLPLAGDLDGHGVAGLSIQADGKIDAALSDATDSGLVQLLGSGSPGDLSEDGVSDPTLLATATATVTVRPSGGVPDVSDPFGIPGAGNTVPAPGAYDGAGVTELAVYLPQQGAFAVRPYFGGPDVIFDFVPKGVGPAIPVPADYDGSGQTEFAVYLPELGEFAYLPAKGAAPLQGVPIGPIGVGNAIPVPADYDGTGASNVAVYVPAQGAFLIRDLYTGQVRTIPFGIPGAGNSIPVPGDYEGDGRDQIAVYMPSTGILAYRPDDGGPDVFIKVGVAGAADLPSPGDYDGSGKLEAAVYDPATATFSSAPAAGGPIVSQSFGTAETATIPFVAASDFDAPPPQPVPGVTPASAEIPLTTDVLDTLAGTPGKKKAATG